jgi:hypothetical protein
MATRASLPKHTYFVLVSPDSEDLRGSEVITVAAPDAYTAAWSAAEPEHGHWIVISIMDADGGDYTDTPLLANVSGETKRRVFRMMADAVTG